MRIRVGPEQEGERADKVVAAALGESRAAARRLIEAGRVTVDGEPIQAKLRLQAGATLVVRVPPPVPEVVAEPVPFEVRYEDRHLAVIDKPSGVVVHPGAGHRTGTLVSGLLHRWPELEALGPRHRWGLVHRLDRPTSGLLLVAREAEVHARLQEQLRRRTVQRQYLGLVHGTLEAATGTIEAPLGRDPDRPTRRAVVAGGKGARTHYRRLAEWDGPEATLLTVDLETGRTHQVRVHLASIGRPLVGDRTYGRPGPEEIDPGRVWLHAARLRFSHPIGGEEVEVRSPLPEDLRRSLQALGPPVRGELPP